MLADTRDLCAVIVANDVDGDLIWREVAGKSLLAWSVAAFTAASSIVRILLVVPEAQVSRAQAFCEQVSPVVMLAGGGWRPAGVKSALRELSSDCHLVAIHDATRPLVTPALIEAGVALARETGSAIPVEPVKETIKRVRDGVIIGAVPRERLARVQTPQCFTRALLLEAYQRAAPDFDPLNEAALLLTVGLPIHCYEGSAENLRVSSAGDLSVVEELLRRRLG
jgi:2-C-methyl-D-erythritol 4-phosphate cytidylyltransferase